MEGGLLLDVVVAQGAAIFKLLSSKDKTLLIRGDSFLILNLSLDIINGVARLDVEGDGLSGKSLDEDLHSSAETEHQMEGRLLLDVVVAQGAAILKLLSSKDKTLLIRGDSFLILNLSLDIVDGVARLDIEGDGLSGEGLNENLRRTWYKINVSKRVWKIRNGVGIAGPHCFHTWAADLASLLLSLRFRVERVGRGWLHDRIADKRTRLPWSHPGPLPLSELGVTGANHDDKWPLLARLFLSVSTQLHVQLSASAAVIEEAIE